MVCGGKCGIGAAEQGEGVVGGAGRSAAQTGSGSRIERDALDLGGLQTEGLELRGDVGGGDKFVVRGAAASAQSVGGEERHFAVDVVGDVGGYWAWSRVAESRTRQTRTRERSITIVGARAGN